MTVDKLSRLFSAIGQPAQSPVKKGEDSSIPSEASGQAQRAVDATTFSLGNTSKAIAELTDNSAKLSSIKQAVSDGSYKPDSKSVAKSFVQYLG